jgi:hypothetical protein
MREHPWRDQTTGDTISNRHRIWMSDPCQRRLAVLIIYCLVASSHCFLQQKLSKKRYQWSIKIADTHLPTDLDAQPTEYKWLFLLVLIVTQILITVDTELSALFHQRGTMLATNFASSINGECAEGRFGIGWQMAQMEARGLKGVFFVDPLPSLVYGEGWLADVVGPITVRGHEVQLHIHTEWLAWAKESPVDGRQGQNLADFCLEDQRLLLSLALDLLMRAGAPRPTAFRAGNYGADDNSLRVLAELGLTWDSSVNAPYLGGACRIGVSANQVSAVERYGIVEIPVAGLNDRVGQVRPAQICALSAREMRGALSHAADHQHGAFVIVTHSFEMLSRDRKRANRAVIARFEAMCEAIAADLRLVTAGFNDLDTAMLTRASAEQPTRLGPNRLRTFARIAEQAVATWRYERQLRPV